MGMKWTFMQRFEIQLCMHVCIGFLQVLHSWNFIWCNNAQLNIWSSLMQRSTQEDSNKNYFVFFWALFIFYEFLNLKRISENLYWKKEFWNIKNVRTMLGWLSAQTSQTRPDPIAITARLAHATERNTSARRGSHRTQDSYGSMATADERWPRWHDSSGVSTRGGWGVHRATSWSTGLTARAWLQWRWPVRRIIAAARGLRWLAVATACPYSFKYEGVNQ
jgi:hypothetical protein